MRSRATVALLAMLMASPAFAQNEVCLDQRTGQVDQQATQTWQQMVRSSDRQLMQAMSGTWYAEIRAPQTNQVDYQYRTFQSDGQFQYQSRICGGMTNLCSDFSGFGLYAAIPLGGGQYQVMLMVSDLSRNRLCSGGAGRFIDQTTIQDSTGQYWRRVR